MVPFSCREFPDGRPNWVLHRSIQVRFGPVWPCIRRPIEHHSVLASHPSRGEVYMTGHVLPKTGRAGSPADEIAEARLEGLLEGLDMPACGGILIEGSGL